MAAFTPRQASKELGGKNTQVFMQSFADRVLVLVTQMGKVGNLIQATLPATASLLPPNSDASQPNALVLPEPSPAIELATLLGSAPSPELQVLHSLYASQIATIIWTEESRNGLESFRRSVVVGLALSKSKMVDDADDLSKETRNVFEGVMSLLYDLLRANV